MPDENTLASPAQTPTDSPDPAATPDPEPLQAQGEPSGEPGQVGDGEGDAPKPGPVAWATIPEASDVIEHESIKPLVEERVTTAREQAQKEGRNQAFKELQPLHDRRVDEMRVIGEKIGRFSADITRMARAKGEDGQPAVDLARLQDLLDDNRETVALFNEERRKDGLWDGAASLVKELGDVMKSEALLSDFRPRLERLQRGGTDSSIFTDMVDAIADSAKEPLKAELKERDAKITRLEKEVRDAQRNGQPDPANPPGGAGGGGKSKAEEDEILMNPETHISVIKEITARRKG